MSHYRRQTTRVDASQQPIVDALRAAGVQTWVIGFPVDLLTLYRGRWLPLECKTLTPTGKVKRAAKGRREAQELFIAVTGCPVVGTPEQALEAVGVVGCNGARLRFSLISV